MTFHNHSVFMIPLYNKYQFFEMRISPTIEDIEFEYISENGLECVIPSTMKQWDSVRKIV